MTVPNRAVPPPHTFRLEPWSSDAPPSAGKVAAVDPPGVTADATVDAAGEAPRVMGFLHDLDAATYDLRQRVLDAGLLMQPIRLVRVATWVRGRMREFRRLLAPAAKPR